MPVDDPCDIVGSMYGIDEHFNEVIFKNANCCLPPSRLLISRSMLSYLVDNLGPHAPSIDKGSESSIAKVKYSRARVLVHRSQAEDAHKFRRRFYVAPPQGLSYFIQF